MRNLSATGETIIACAIVCRGTRSSADRQLRPWDEARLVTLGLLRGHPVSIIHTESAYEITVTSFRKATRREQQIYARATS